MWSRWGVIFFRGNPFLSREDFDIFFPYREKVLKTAQGVTTKHWYRQKTVKALTPKRKNKSWKGSR